jgi:hypothetical protein
MRRMRRILFALCGTIVLVLLGLTPGYARPLFQSDLVCTAVPPTVPAQDPSGSFTSIKASGKLYVQLRTDPPLPGVGPFMCEIKCLGVVVAGPMLCGRTGLTKANGRLTILMPGLPPAFTCLNPSVEVTSGVAGFMCESGHTTP